MDKLMKKLVEDATSWWSDYGKLLVVGFSGVASGVSLYILILLVSPHVLRVSFLDIGQGDAILVQTPSGHNMLIDGGPSDSVLARMSEEMSYFDRDLDVMIATHDDADHVTGLIPVLQTYDVRTIVTSPVTSDTDIAQDLHKRMSDETSDRYVGRRGDVIDFGDGVATHILYPNGNVSSKTDTNDASVSVIITYGNHSFLLTGDLPSKREQQLFGNTLLHSITVYKAGHHGSKTSSGEELLTYIKPEYAIISAGKDNRYGHPNAEAIARLEKYSKETLSTIDRGTVTFESDGKMIVVGTEK